ncbi:MAG: polyhydroxyalkanoate synthesis regulator DNA-binding domain-containing protein [Acidobacteriota bacterium]
MSYVIKKYSNRKLYDTERRRYTTIAEIGELVKSGREGIQVVESSTGADITASIMAQVILEDEKTEQPAVSMDTLKRLIQQGEKSIRGLADKVAPKVPESIRTWVAEGRKATDKGLRFVKEESEDIRKEIQRMRKRIVAQLSERAVTALYPHGPSRKDITELTAKIEVLNRKLESLNGIWRPRAEKPARRSPGQE